MVTAIADRARQEYCTTGRFHEKKPYESWFFEDGFPTSRLTQFCSATTKKEQESLSTGVRKFWTVVD